MNYNPFIDSESYAVTMRLVSISTLRRAAIERPQLLPHYVEKACESLAIPVG